MEINNEKEFIENFIIFMKMFGDNEYVKTKFLLDNNAFTDEFYNKIYNNKILSDDTSTEIPNFKTIKELVNYFKDILDNYNNIDLENDALELVMNERLKIALEKEDYKTAIDIRDFLFKRNLKIYN